MTNLTRKSLFKLLQKSQKSGNIRMSKRIMAILAIGDGILYSVIANTLNVCEESIRLWRNAFLLKGAQGLKAKNLLENPVN